MLTVINSGDTAWILICAALAFLMTPGLAFFYAGLVRRKNVLSVLMQGMTVICLVSVQWVLFGYSLAFGPDHNGWIGSLAWAGLSGVGADSCVEYGASIPHQVFMIFQLMVAIFTPALILGAVVERMKFSAFCLFILLWSTFVYDPVAHWIWAAGGFLRNAGILDFAGGIVIHLNAGVAALAAALVLGKRREFPKQVSPPHNLPLAVLGAAVMWFGWLGMNAGFALGAGGLASNVFVMTFISAATAALMWILLDWIFNKHPTMLGMITGALAGLVAITPAAGFVTLGGTIGIGISVSLLCYIPVAIAKEKFKYDDALDVFAVHGLGGLWGAFATGLWATKSINANAANGFFYGNFGQMGIQLKAILATTIYSFAVSYLLLKFIDALIGLRVSEQAELIGLDLSQHRESGYTLLD